MDENQQDKTESKLIATDNKSQLPSFSPEDEKEAQKELDRLRKRLHENENGAVNVTRKLNRKRSGFEDKTFWDWLNLLGILAIPLVVVGATIAFGLLQIHLADVQHQSDQKLAQQQHEADQHQALDQQRAIILQTYVDNIQDLLLHENLLKSNPTDGVAILARARTLTALRGLDPERKGLLVQFIYESHLIGFLDISPTRKIVAHTPIIILFEADLSDANLSGVNPLYDNLSGAELKDTNLRGANLSVAYLREADLAYANLRGANLSEANLTGADLRGADLRGAYLYSNVFTGANLTGADLSEANLLKVNVHCTSAAGNCLPMEASQNLTQQQLDQVSSCKNAILPPGLTCHHNEP